MPVEVTRVVEIEIPKIEYVSDNDIPMMADLGNLYCHFLKDSDYTLSQLSGMRTNDIWDLWGSDIDFETLSALQTKQLLDDTSITMST